MSQLTPNGEAIKEPVARRDDVQPPPPEGSFPAPPRSSLDPPQQGMTWLAPMLLIVVLVGIIAGVIGSLVGSKYFSYQAIDRLADVPGRVIRDVRDALEADDPTFITLPPVVEQLRPLARLQTEEFFLSTVIEVTQPRGAGGVLTEKLVLIACGRVIAGVDLSKIQQDNIQHEGTRVTVKLPPAEIFGTTLEEETGCTRVYDRSVPALMSPSEELDNQARRQALDSFRETALENNILERAYGRAQEEIARLLLVVGYETVEFTDIGEEILLPQE